LLFALFPFLQQFYDSINPDKDDNRCDGDYQGGNITNDLLAG
jgi:hypothetical protein